MLLATLAFHGNVFGFDDIRPTDIAYLKIQFLPTVSRAKDETNPPFPWILTKMNFYSNHNYKQYSPTSNNCSSNTINYPILLPKNLLLKIYNLKHRTKMKLKV